MKKLAVGGLFIAFAVAAVALGSGLASAAEPAPAPAPPPVPVVYQPVDASQGLLGIQRGNVPSLATPDLSQMAGGPSVLPGVQLDALPTPEAEPVG